MRTVVCEVCERGVAMDAVNFIGPTRVASLVPALEKMPQLTSLNLNSPQHASDRGFGDLCSLGCFCGVLF